MIIPRTNRLHVREGFKNYPTILFVNTKAGSGHYISSSKNFGKNAKTAPNAPIHSEMERYIFPFNHSPTKTSDTKISKIIFETLP